MSSANVPAPCIVCGRADYLTASRCPDCRRAKDRQEARGTRREHPNRPDRTGPTSTAWKRLRARARRLQPWCLICGRGEAQLADHERLELDHKPSAWARMAAGRAVRLSDVQMTCSACNRALGPSQPGSERYRRWEATGSDERHDDASRATDPRVAGTVAVAAGGTGR